MIFRSSAIDSFLISESSTFLGLPWTAVLVLPISGFKAFAFIEMTRARGTLISPKSGERNISVAGDDSGRISPMS